MTSEKARRESMCLGKWPKVAVVADRGTVTSKVAVHRATSRDPERVLRCVTETRGVAQALNPTYDRSLHEEVCT